SERRPAASGPRPATSRRTKPIWKTIRAVYGVPMPRSLVVKVTAGVDAPERCAQAFTVAATAAAAGVPVSLWLTGESAWFALPGRAGPFELPHSPPPSGLLATGPPTGEG